LVEPEVIRTFDSLEALGEFIDAGADGDPTDEVLFRDERGTPLTPEQMLELARQIERETGHKLIFRRGEQPRAA
jgi:hypothetical protein